MSGCTSTSENRDVASCRSPDICDSTTEQCPLANRSIEGRFGESSVKCGDNVELQADVREIADGAEATFDLKSLHNCETIESLSQNLENNMVRDFEWTTQRPSDHSWGEQVTFIVSADGVEAESSNRLSFFQYPVRGLEEKEFARTSGEFGWTGKFDIEFNDGKVIVTVKIRLINRQGQRPSSASDPMPEAGDPVSDDFKQEMREDIEEKLSGKWALHREECQRGDECDCPLAWRCCKSSVRIVVEFVESGEHHIVNLFQGRGRASATNWTRIKTRDNSWAHETGHLLGWYDEYSTGATGTRDRWQRTRAGAIMNTGLDVPEEYYWDFRDWYQEKTDEEWRLIEP